MIKRIGLLTSGGDCQALNATTQTRSNFINTKEQTLMARKHMYRGYLFTGSIPRGVLP